MPSIILVYVFMKFILCKKYSSHFFLCAHCVLFGDKMRESYTTGWLFLSKQHRNTDFELSVWIVTLLFGSKEISTEVLTRLSLISFKALIWSSVHYYTVSFFRRLLIGAVSSEKLGIKLLIKFKKPNSFCSYFLLVGNFKFWITSIRDESNIIPFLSKRCPKNLTWLLQNWSYLFNWRSLLNLTLYFLDLLTNFFKIASCSILVSAATIKSSK